MKKFFRLLFLIKILIQFSSLSGKGHDTAIDFHVYMKIILFNGVNYKVGYTIPMFYKLLLFYIINKRRNFNAM
ncbi:hypothetical protein COK98_09390 [Bacillus cereus]|uniref:Uncharacterized protein n=1 Tax=Bacillus cereus TaxID=1396 RepID=A0A9X7G8E0_BACCE|nr:hypothetical protein CON26_31080 [Bacillus cereus]PFV08304.1 hypothetical protein COK98_09390 [Bacillus cereus]